MPKPSAQILTISVPLPPLSRQLRIAFAPNQLRGMTASERAKAVAVLASLLMQAAGIGESNDGEH